MKHLLAFIFLLYIPLSGILAHSIKKVKTITLPTQTHLPVASIHTIMQDSEGYFWYATYGGGLCKDNGYDIEVFRNDRFSSNILTNNDVICMEEDYHGDIWFSTKTGIYILSKTDYTISLLDSAFINKRCSDILCSNDGNIWLACGSEILKFSNNRKLIATFPCICKGEKTIVTKLCSKGDGSIWGCLYNGGLICVNQGKTQTFEWNNLKNPCTITEDSIRECLWVGTWGNGICRVNFEEETQNIEVITQPTTMRKENQQLGEVLCLQIDYKRNLLWCSTMTGVYAYHIQNNELQPTTLNGYVQNEENTVVDGIILDRTGNVWVSGFTPHSFIISPLNDEIIRSEATTASNGIKTKPRILSIAATQNDSILWLWKDRSGLSYYNKADGKDIPFKHFETRQTIAQGINNSVWVEDDRKNLYNISFKNNELTHSEPIHLPEHVTALADDRKGHLYIGTRKTLLCYDYKAQKLITAVDTTKLVRDIKISDNGKIYYITTAQGLCELGGEILAPYNRFNQIAIDKHHHVWVANTLGSIFKYNQKAKVVEEVKEASTDDGNSVLSMGFDSDNHLWIVSDLNVKEYNPENGAQRQFSIYDSKIQMDNFCTAVCTMQGICIGGSGGLCDIKSSSKLNHDNIISLNLGVSTYIYRGKKHFVGLGQSEITLEPKRNDILELHFTSFNPINAPTTRFSYRIPELSDEWATLDEGENKVRLHNLPKGDYHLFLRATDKENHWCEPVMLLTIHRLPFWWQTWWAYLIYVILTLFIIYSVYKYYRFMQHRRTQFDLMLKLLREQDGVSIADKATNGLAGNKTADQDDKKNEIDKKEQDKETIFQEESISIKKADRELLERAIEVVQKNVDNTDYDVELFAKDMLMSRTTLLRRIRNIAGQSPNDFIRTVRLEYAAQLILQSDYSFAAISDMCGFSSPSYFTKCFKQKYGVLPKNYKG